MPRRILERSFERLADLLGLEIYLQYGVAPDGAALELESCGGVTDEQRRSLERLALVGPPCAPVAEALRALGVAHTACEALLAGGELVGALAFGRREGPDFDAPSIALMRTVADLVAEAITRSKAEAALRESEARFRGLAEGMPHMVWETDANGYNLYHSPLWYRYVGETQGTTHGVDFLRFYHPDDRPLLLAEWTEARRTEGLHPYDVEARIRRHDGAWRWFRVKGAPIRDASGRVARWVGTCTDIDEQKRMERERATLLDAERAARGEAERANLMKDRFLAAASHELRTPLNAILGWAHILRRTEDPARMRQAVEVIERNARSQARLIDDLLDMSRIISGRLKLETEAVDFREILADAIEVARPDAEEKSIRLHTRLDPRAALLRGDAARLRQVASKLLGNAVKFTPPAGTVTVALRRLDGEVELSVSDTGKGIAADELPKIFAPYRQPEALTTRRHGGLGLGLAIVKRLVELHGGRVTAASAGANRGATFTVALPLAQEETKAEADEAAARREPPLTGVKVLAVDDEPDSLSVVRHVLEECDARVFTASSAAEGLSLLVRERPDVLLSDIGMPGVDGYQFIRQVRALHHDRGGQVPAAALTAYARPEDRSHALLSGYQAHIAKPMHPAELIETVRVLAGRGSDRPRAS